MRRCREVGGVGLQDREGEEDHMPIKAMLACVWGSHMVILHDQFLPWTVQCFITLHVWLHTYMYAELCSLKDKETMHT